MWSLMICTPHQILFMRSNRDEWDERGLQHVWWRGEEHTGFWWGKPEGKRPLGRVRRKWEDNIKMDLQEVGLGAMDRIDLAQDTDRWRALVNALITFRFHKMRGVSWLAENRLASRRTLPLGVSKARNNSLMQRQRYVTSSPSLRPISTVDLVTQKFEVNKHPPLAT